MGSHYDRVRADAESRLEALDDAAFEADAQQEVPETNDGQLAASVDPDDVGVRLDDPDIDLLDEDLDVGLRDDGEATALDVLAELFNARDLDELMQVIAEDGEAPGLLAYDRSNLPEAIEDLWERRPTCLLTRGFIGDEHVGVLWEYDGESWWRVAAVHVDDVVEGMVGVIEFSDDPDLLEQLTAEPPDANELEEGARWSEWEEGVDGS